VTLIVQKYGGTSVGTIERIHRITETDAQACKAPVRDANQFVFKLFAKG
jgi:aspartokinase